MFLKIEKLYKFIFKRNSNFYLKFERKTNMKESFFPFSIIDFFKNWSFIGNVFTTTFCAIILFDFFFFLVNFKIEVFFIFYIYFLR